MRMPVVLASVFAVGLSSGAIAAEPPPTDAAKQVHQSNVN